MRNGRMRAQIFKGYGCRDMIVTRNARSRGDVIYGPLGGNLFVIKGLNFTNKLGDDFH